MRRSVGRSLQVWCCDLVAPGTGLFILASELGRLVNMALDVHRLGGPCWQGKAGWADQQTKSLAMAMGIPGASPAPGRAPGGLCALLQEGPRWPVWKVASRPALGLGFEQFREL